MKYKVSELEGEALDRAVAKTEGSIWGAGKFRPSTDWDDGGPIIERERISLLEMALPDKPAEWWANPSISMTYQDIDSDWRGPTPLIAAMRAYVASKFGEEVDLP